MTREKDGMVGPPGEAPVPESASVKEARARITGAALESHYRFLLWLMPSVDRFPRTRKFVLGDRLQAAALDVLEHLVEATWTRRRRDPLVRANLGLEKLRLLCRLAWELQCLDHRRYEHAARSLDETGRRIGAWQKAHRAREERRASQGTGAV